MIIQKRNCRKERPKPGQTTVKKRSQRKQKEEEGYMGWFCNIPEEWGKKKEENTDGEKMRQLKNQVEKGNDSTVRKPGRNSSNPSGCKNNENNLSVALDYLLRANVVFRTSLIGPKVPTGVHIA